MFVDIRTKEDLLSYRDEIATLFKESFNRELSIEEWNWFYIDNPVGQPIVSLFYKEEKLLGHYGVIPTRFILGNESCLAYRSMTTMCHPQAGVPGLFISLAKRVYSLLKAEGAALVYGFPNKNSAQGFEKFLGWTLPKPDNVYDLNGSDLISNKSLCSVLTTVRGIAWDENDTEQMTWRAARPNAKTINEEGFLAKTYENSLNILSIRLAGLSKIRLQERYRILIPSGFDDETLSASLVFPYQFGYRIFNTRFSGYDFHRELIMSDVF